MTSPIGILLTYFSFVGLFHDGMPLGGRTQALDQYGLLTLKAACLMGATANVLIVVGSVSACFRTYRVAFVSASVATALAVLVLLPLGVWRGPLTLIHVGYLCWAGSAGLLTYASAQIKGVRTLL